MKRHERDIDREHRSKERYLARKMIQFLWMKRETIELKREQKKVPHEKSWGAVQRRRHSRTDRGGRDSLVIANKIRL